MEIKTKFELKQRVWVIVFTDVESIFEPVKVRISTIEIIEADIYYKTSLVGGHQGFDVYKEPSLFATEAEAHAECDKLNNRVAKQ